jgi:hypothetical protein
VFCVQEKFNTDDRVGRGFSNFGGVGGFAKGIDSIIRDMDTDGDGTIGLKEFTGVMKKYQHFMSPAFDLWQKLEGELFLINSRVWAISLTSCFVYSLCGSVRSYVRGGEGGW